MTDPKLSQPGAVGLKRYCINRVRMDDGLVGIYEQPNEPEKFVHLEIEFVLASEVDVALSAKDAEIKELKRGIGRPSREIELAMELSQAQAKLSAAEAELARVREALEAIAFADSGDLRSIAFAALNAKGA